MHLAIEDRFRIWQEPASERRGNLCEPRITCLDSGRIVLSFRRGTARSSADGSPHLLASNDDGRTWTDLGGPLDELLPGRPGWDYRATSLAELPSGALLACCVGLDRSSPDRPVEMAYNPDPAAYQGMIPVRNLLSRSDDGGRTWSAVWPMDGMTVPNSSAQGLVVLPDGRILAPLETFKTFDEPGPWRYRVDVVRSDDEGRTWGRSAPAHVTDVEDDPRRLMAWDPRMARLPGGRIVSLYYAFLDGDGGEGPVHVGWSDDDGLTWRLPQPTSLEGQAACPIVLDADRLIAFTQRRLGRQRMVATFSLDGGATFEPDAEVVIYEHEAESAPGHVDGADAAGYMNDMDGFTFGHPAGVRLGPDRALLVWYAGDRERSTIEGATVRLT